MFVGTGKHGSEIEVLPKMTLSDFLVSVGVNTTYELAYTWMGAR